MAIHGPRCRWCLSAFPKRRPWSSGAPVLAPNSLPADSWWGGVDTRAAKTEIFSEFEVNDLSRMPRYVKYIKYWCYFWHGHSCCQCQTVLWIRHRWGILGSPRSGITSSSVPIARVNKTSTCNGDDVYHGNWDRDFPGVCGQLALSMWGVLTFLARTILKLWNISIGDLMMVNPQE